MALLKLLTVLAVAGYASSNAANTTVNKTGNFELLILHNNDMHARFEQTSQLSGTCTPADRDAGKCYGGFPRVAYVVKEARKAAASGQGPPVLYLNAGDTYTGTAWFTLYKWKIAAEFINALEPDAVSLGNNEFQYGSSDVSEFLENIKTPVLASNFIVNSLQGYENIQKSATFDINGNKIGIVGYLKPTKDVLDSIGNVEYIDEVLAIQDAVDQLQSKDVNIIIALGHSDNQKNLEIAEKVNGIDLVIAGYKNSYYWNGSRTDNEDSELFLKPKIVTQKSGKKIPVIQSFAYTKYLGKVVLSFDSEGDLMTYSVDPIILDATVDQDTETYSITRKYQSEFTRDATEVIGNTSVVLDGDSCSLEECNFGNFIADAMMFHHALAFEGSDGVWTDAPIAVINGGAIASSIAPSNRPASITRGDLLVAIPTDSNIVAVTINGTLLQQLLEFAVFDYNPSKPSETFLQYSGIRVTYDMAQPPGSRFVNAVVRCWSCWVPTYYTIDDWRDYKILMPANLVEKLYIFTELSVEELPYDEITCVSEFLTLRSPVYPEVANRITLQNLDDLEIDDSEEDDGEEIGGENEDITIAETDSAFIHTPAILLLGLSTIFCLLIL